jgi:hypothetical protein
MPDRQTSSTDEKIRHIEQEALTDSDLETVVPPTTPFGGMTTWWRIGAALLALALIVWVILQAF